MARGARRWHRRLWIALACLAAGGLALLAYVLWTGYRAAWRDEVATARSQAELLDARFEATLRRVDAALSDLSETVPAEAMGREAVAGRRKQLEARMDRYRRVFPEVAGFRIIGEDGALLYLAGDGDYHVNLGDRPYFSEARADRSGRLVFSDVIRSRITGRSVIVAAKAIRAPDGRFLGIASAAIDLAYLDRLFKALRLGDQWVLAVRRLDTHRLIVRQPELPGGVDHVQESAAPVDRRIADGERRGDFEIDSPSGGHRHIFAFRVLRQYPFYVIAGVSNVEVAAKWRRRAVLAGGMGAGLFGSLGLVLFWLFRAQRREFIALQQLRRNREQLREAQRVARVGSWELDLASGALAWSDELYHILELDPGAVTGSYELFLAAIHPEDRDRVDRAYRESVAGRQPYEIEYRLLMKDGRIKFVRECGETAYGEDGTPLRSIGTAQDITGTRQLESRMQLLSSAFQHSSEAILITDESNRIVTVNAAFTRLTGYAPEDAVGRDPRFLSAGRTTREEYEQMWHSINELGFWQGELWDRRKDGGVYPKFVSISVIRDDVGKIRFYVAHFNDVTAVRAAEAKLHRMAHHDALTGLLNRFSLKGRLDQALAAARRDGERVALLFIDLDRFKVINDTLGHHVGDELLIEVAKRLRKAVRESDVVARLGGDEFVIMLTGIEYGNEAAAVAQKLVAALGEPYGIGGHDLYTTPSIGIAIFPVDGENGDVLLRNADAAMYHAKMAGRNNFQFFDAKMNDAAVERLKTEHGLRQALARGEFVLHFQPVVDLADGRVVCVEALVRWQHPDKGLLSPANFIGIAEETGLIQPLGEWVFWEACRQLSEFRKAGLGDITMAVNISAVQMRNGNLPVLAQGAIEAFGLRAGDLVFEITESVAMAQPAETVRILGILHDMGVKLAIDDFGTGYSSLGYLRMFPIDHLKLDRSFVEEIGQSEDGGLICNATLGLAHSLGLKLIAEGVETPAQLDYLKARGCDFAQGYLFARPVAAAELAAIVRERNA